MMDLKIKDIVKAINGTLIGSANIENETINKIETDTRADLKDCLFIALVGDNFDGNDFVNDAFLKGAKLAIVSKNIETHMSYIKVDDTKKALMDLAKFYRDLFDVKVIAITGSSGKTTTKEIISNVLEEKYNVLKTEGNFNNEIGLPLTIFKLTKETEVVVLEMGMNNFGEIHNLSKIASPDICIITNIGVSHIEHLGSREGILKAKSEIFDFMKKDGKIILNGDDDMLLKLKNTKKNIICFGLSNNNDIYADNININGVDGSSFTLNYKNIQTEYKIKSSGKHMILNSLAGILIGEIFGLYKDDIKEAIEDFETKNMRQEIIKTNNYTIINDVYNANPGSVKAAIDVLSAVDGSKVCILGDMLELGVNSNKYHYEIGQYAYDSGINVIVCVGINSYHIYEGASIGLIENENKTQRVIYFEQQAMLIDNLNKFLKKGDTILVKASRGMNLEKTINKLLMYEKY